MSVIGVVNFKTMADARLNIAHALICIARGIEGGCWELENGSRWKAWRNCPCNLVYLASCRKLHAGYVSFLFVFLWDDP